MNKLEQAARQALKALENNLPINYVENGLGEKFPCFSNDPLRESNTREAITALRKALSEQALQKLSDFHQSIEQDLVVCKHEWFRTGAMDVGESRCIHCGEWNNAAPVQQAEPAAWMNAERNTITWDKLYPNMTPLYVTPQTPDVCGEVCERAKLCYGCGKNLDEANADHERKYGELAGTHNWTPPNYTDEQWQKLDQEYQDHVAEQEQVCIDWDTKTDEPIMGYAAPVRTKDLTDDEIRAIRFNWERNEFAIDFARAVIAADREKNK